MLSVRCPTSMCMKFTVMAVAGAAANSGPTESTHKPKKSHSRTLKGSGTGSLSLPKPESTPRRLLR